MAKGWIPHGTTVTFASTAIGGLRSISLPDQTRGDVQTTDTNSGGTHTYAPGIREGGTITLVCLHDPEDAGQLALEANYAADGETGEVVITLPDNATASSPVTTYTFDGYVNAIGGDEYDLTADEPGLISYTIKVAGAVTKATA